MPRRLLRACVGFALTLLIACTARDRIWNSGDLAAWVRDQAVEQGFQRESVEIEDWYREEGDGRLVWHGKGRKEGSEAAEDFAIRVDPVWTPSGG